MRARPGCVKHNPLPGRVRQKEYVEIGKSDSGGVLKQKYSAETDDDSGKGFGENDQAGVLVAKGSAKESKSET